MLLTTGLQETDTISAGVKKEDEPSSNDGDKNDEDKKLDKKDEDKNKDDTGEKKEDTKSDGAKPVDKASKGGGSVGGGEVEAQASAPAKQESGAGSAMSSTEGGSPPPSSPAKSCASEASMQVVFASAEPDAVKQYRERVRRLSTRQLLESNKFGMPFKGKATDFSCRAEMEKLVSDIYHVTTSEEFLDIEQKWNVALRIAREMSGGLRQASTDMTGHIKGVQTRRKQQNEIEIREAQRRELARVREEAKTKADQVKSKVAAAANTAPPLYQVVVG